MKRIAWISLVGAWAAMGGEGWAQMSTFPPPPPLPPPTQSAPSQPATSPPSTPDNPAAAPAGQGAPGAFNQSPSVPATSNTDSANSANVAPQVTAEKLTSMSALDDKDKLHPGDLISFRVVEDRDPALPRMVTDTGEVDFPYVGRMKVDGMTCYQVAVELKKLLEVDYYKRATVIIGLDVIADNSSKVPPVIPHNVVWVIGQVRSVGPQEISPTQPLTVSQIILRAGGFGDFADQRRVKIVHRSALAPAGPGVVPSDSEKENGQVIDVKSVLEGHSTPDPVVEPNDYIIVPKRFINL